jgi:hypothetical protein
MQFISLILHRPVARSDSIALQWCSLGAFNTFAFALRAARVALNGLAAGLLAAVCSSLPSEALSAAGLSGIIATCGLGMAQCCLLKATPSYHLPETKVTTQSPHITHVFNELKRQQNRKSILQKCGAVI